MSELTSDKKFKVCMYCVKKQIERDEQMSHKFSEESIKEFLVIKNDIGEVYLSTRDKEFYLSEYVMGKVRLYVEPIEKKMVKKEITLPVITDVLTFGKALFDVPTNAKNVRCTYEVEE